MRAHEHGKRRRWTLVMLSIEQDVQLEDQRPESRVLRIATPDLAPPVKRRTEDDDDDG